MKKQTQKTYKILSLLLAGLMIFCSLELSVFAADESAEQTESLTVAPETALEENDVLFEGYLNKMFYGDSNVSMFAVGEYTAGAKLTGDAKLAYDALVPFIKEIALGNRTSTTIKIGVGTSASPVDATVEFTDTWENFNATNSFHKVIAALMSDYPFEMYWYNKVEGCDLGGSTDYEGYIQQLNFQFKVAKNYEGDAAYTIDTSIALSAVAAVENAHTIINENEDKSDFEKLYSYSEKIKSLVEYDSDAADAGNFTEDDDPWQLVHVFDGDPETNVVCEGYAKAFQYLCDLTIFDGDVFCYSVSGVMTCDGAGGGHMWNIVTLEGSNYLMDVTNIDGNSIGSDGTLFLAGTTNGSIANGYTFTNTYDTDILFTYSEDTINTWGNGDDSILKLASADYTPPITCDHTDAEFTYAASGAKITSTCNTCQKVIGTFEVVAPTNLTYDGLEKNATVTGSILGIDTPTVSYSVKSGADLSGAPTEVGTYVASITVGGKTASIQFSVGSMSISSATVTVSNSVSYNGTAQTPSVSVVLNTKTLILNTDYTLTYSDNTNAGQGTVTVTGTGNYSGTVAQTFTIEKISPVAADFIYTAPATLTYDGSAKVAAVVSALSEEKTGLGAVTVKYYQGTTQVSSPVNAGTYTVRIDVAEGDNYNAISDLTDNTWTFTITEKTVNAPAFDGLNPKYTHTGNAVEPTFTLKDGENVIPASEYTVTYSNNIDAGTATVTIQDITGGNYIISGSQTFEIIVHSHAWSYTANDDTNTITAICSDELGACPFKTTTITLIAPTDLVYNGTSKNATVTGSIDSVTTPDVSYFDVNGTPLSETPKDAGDYIASITIDGKTVSVNYSITATSISNATLTVTGTSTYSGTAQTPSVTVNLNGKTLTKDTDYTLAYSNNVNAGQATVTITGKGNYSGTVTQTFTIEKLTPVLSDFVYTAPTTLTYDALEKNADVAANLSTGKTGIGTVTVKYYLNGTEVASAVNAGTYSVKINVAEGDNYKAANDLTDSAWTFTISAKTVTAPVFEGLNAQYVHTGSAIEPTFVLKDGEYEIPASEYTVTYSNNIESGTAAITVTDNEGGNYIVSGSTTFEIVTHAHVWTYVADEDSNTITATCSGEIGTCPVINKTVVITLDAPSGEFVYDGTLKQFSLIQSPAGVFTDLDIHDISLSNDCTSAGVHSLTLAYGGKSVSATFTIKQAESRYTVPTGLTATYGDTLADVVLPDNFTWQDAVTTKVGNAGSNVFKVTYTPDDVVNYTTVRDIEVTINVVAKDIAITFEIADGTYTYTGTEIKPAISVKNGTEIVPETEYVVTYSDNVNAGTATVSVAAKTGGNCNFTTVSKTFIIAKAENAPGIPSSSLSVSYSCEKIADAVLSEDWEWLAADKDTALKVDVAVTATAHYIGTDKDNYENTCIVVTVTRAACTHSGGTATCVQKATCTVCGEQYGSLGGHGLTEVRGYTAATCAANGYTGDTYCKTCGNRTAYGTITAKLVHNYISVITKEPTCTETGIKTHTCAGCNDVLTETLLQTGHDYESRITLEPTTEREGVRTYTCKNCDSLYTKSIDKLEPVPEKTEPFIKGDDGKEGWEVIENKLSSAKDDDIYIVNMNGSSVVPGNVIESIKGKEVIVVFDLGNDITWRVNGINVTADNIDDVDFAIEVGTDNIPDETLKNVLEDRKATNITLAYEGKFGYKAVLSINMGAENAGLYANLFYYNTTSKQLEFVCADDVAKDGTATLTFDHASDYVIVLDAASMYNVDVNKNPGSDTETQNGNIEENTDDTHTDGTGTQDEEEKEAVSDSVSEGAKDNWLIIWFLIGGGALLIIILVVVLLVKRKNDLDF